jgi:hypothetical protein
MVQDIYMKLHKGMDAQDLFNNVCKAYHDHDRVRFIFDTTGSSVEVNDMKNMKKVFDQLEEQTQQKLEETCIIVDGDFKRNVISAFLKTVKQQRPVRLL